MSRRETERDRDRASRAASARTNEYFVPKEGIDREVITADICRYLGNDALVRPGTYENPQTRQAQQGYFITAYRNLTTAMIADLKADSERWDAERRQTASRGQPTNVEYRASTTHQSRQYYGPTEAAPGATVGYPSAPTDGAQQGVYDSGYQSQQAYPTQGYPSQGNYYVAGAAMEVERGAGRGQAGPHAGIPRTGTVPYPSSTPTYQTPSDSRTSYYQQPTNQAQSDGRTNYYPPVTSGQPYQQPADPFYGRAAPQAGYGDSTVEYDTRAYPETAAYSQAPPISSTSSTTATSGSSRRDRDRDDRDSRHGHRRR